MIRPVSYMPQLDGIRAVAISLVLFGHFHPQASLIPIPFAWLGVNLFFVLSGYLITRIVQLQKYKIDTHILTKPAAIKTFYIRRVLRLFPLYYLVIGLALLFNVEMGRELWAYLVLYLTNVKIALDGGWVGDFSHLWSLAAEEQFYLLWPWLVIFFQPRRLPKMLILIILSGIVFRTIMAINGHSIYSNTLLFGVTDALGMGALLAVVVNLSESSESAGRISKAFFRWLPTAAAAGMFGAVFLFVTVDWSSTAFSIFATFFVSLPFTWVVWRSSTGFSGLFGRVLASRPLVYLGKISYGVYVIHAFVPSLLIALDITPASLPRWQYAWLLLVVAVTIGLASLSWIILERPVSRFKARYRY